MNIEKRDIVKCIIFTILTFGIYQIYWVIKLMKQSVQFRDVNDDGLLEIVLGIFISPVGFFLAERKLTEGCQLRNIQHSDNSILYIVLGFVGLGIVDCVLMQSDLNKLADMTGGQPFGGYNYNNQYNPGEFHN
ncbi:MAG: DUF4234 domain-containing protein [Clostridia bacterium]|nr:DUF4234 domain-containing protein [Clostridia bacterium]